MKRFVILSLLLFLAILPGNVFAEEAKTYLIHASEEEITAITESYSSVIHAFDELPLLEIALTPSEKAELEAAYATAEVHPDRTYEVAADFVPPSYNTVKGTKTDTAPFTGKGVRVGVLDTGIDTSHPDLNVAGGVCTAAVCSPKVPYDDNFGHGTHVAGIIAAKDDGKGMIGISPGVELYAIKTMNNRGSGSTAQIAKGVEWAIENDIDILNLSISISIDDKPLELILQRAYEGGITIVAAAGNEGAKQAKSTVTFPGTYASTIAVSALNAAGEKETNSSYGPEVEISAPGQRINSTYPVDLDEWDEAQDGYRMLTGTSMAAPHVSGVLAIYQEQYPGLSSKKYRELLQRTAKDIGAPGRDDMTGFGLVQYKREISDFILPKASVDKGHVKIELLNKERGSGWTLTEKGEPVKESAPGVWNLYKTKGTYTFEVAYRDENDRPVKEPVTVQVGEPAFPDVTMASWFAPHISYLYTNGMIGGYTDGTFKPRREITRAEAMILLGRAQGLDGTQRASTFSDVGANNRASGYIQSAREKGLINGFPDGTFRPYQSVTRAEMALLIQNTYKFSVDESKPNRFEDVNESMASYEAVLALTQQGITSGVTASSFGPYDFMNRYSFSVFLARAENPELAN